MRNYPATVLNAFLSSLRGAGRIADYYFEAATTASLGDIVDLVLVISLTHPLKLQMKNPILPILTNEFSFLLLEIFI